MPHMDEAVVTFLFVTWGAALRLGETIGLNRSNYDATTGQLSVEGSFTDVGGRRMKPTKNGDPKKVKLRGAARDQLDAYLLTHPMLPSAPLFTGAKGGRIGRLAIRKAWAAACHAAGLENLRRHDVRHTAITEFARNPGVNLKDIMALGGHRSIQSAMRYVHTDENRNAELTAQLDRQGGGLRRSS
jgi:integrase